MPISERCVAGTLRHVDCRSACAGKDLVAPRPSPLALVPTTAPRRAGIDRPSLNAARRTYARRSCSGTWQVVVRRRVALLVMRSSAQMNGRSLAAVGAPRHGPLKFLVVLAAPICAVDAHRHGSIGDPLRSSTRVSKRCVAGMLRYARCRSASQVWLVERPCRLRLRAMTAFFAMSPRRLSQTNARYRHRPHRPQPPHESGSRGGSVFV